ncbi:unnamed protein product [Lactuca saligna]|uniref:Uncharacterized protein n=1 Tax=Lactuca saligna TaxID=75948 RepID=A0AA35ZLU9_LACSI|nr:unnamed protein product [Lactuca saligna]
MVQSPKQKARVVIKVLKKSEKHVKPDTDELSKEIVPSITGVFKCLKKKAHRSQKYHERFSSFSPSMVRKPHVTWKVLVIREVPVPVSPSSKKRRAEDVAKHISMKSKKRKLIIHEDSMEDVEVPETPMGDVSFKNKSPIKSNLKEIVISNNSVETSIVDTTTIVGVSNTENPASTQGIFEIVVITNNISLPPFVTIVPTTSHSPTFDFVISQPITSLFPSQSTGPPKPIIDDATDDGGFGGSFVDLEFDLEEENLPYHMLMSGKQFKILNKKLN